jgi:hypothetical protein
MPQRNEEKESEKFNIKLEKELQKTLRKLRKAGVDIDSSDIDVTRDMYKNFQSTTDRLIKDENFKRKYMMDTASQFNAEKSFLKKFKTCDGAEMISAEWVQDRLGEIDMRYMEKMLDGSFYSEDVMDTMVCIASSAYLTTSSSLSPNDRIRSWIRNLRQIGTPSVSGVAMLGDAGGEYEETSESKNAFIVKAVRDNSKANELLHEVFVAFAGLNRLRKMCPNFAYVYGYFECSGPLSRPPNDIDPKGKKVATFCSAGKGKNGSVQAVYENVSPAIDFESFTEFCDGESFMQNFFSILMALHIADIQCEFTHYDLHGENVLLRECTDTRYLKSKKNKFYIPYTLTDSDGSVLETYYVTSQGRIPTIIDYGRSHIVKDGKHYGMSGEDSYRYISQNVYNNRSNPIYDAFKFLGMTLSSGYRNKNVKFVSEISPILRHFEISEFNVRHIADERKELSNYYALPLKTDVASLESLIDFCIDYSRGMKWDVVSLKPPVGEFILTPVSELLKTEILEDIGLNYGASTVPEPRTILELFDVLSKNAKALSKYKKMKGEKSIKKVKELNGRYLNIRHDFATFKADDGSDYPDFANAMKYEVKRLTDVMVPYIYGKYEEDSFREAVFNFEDVSGIIEGSTTFTTFAKSIKPYFNDNVLVNARKAVGNAAIFSNMRQTIMVSVGAMKYLIMTYSQVSPKRKYEYRKFIQMLTEAHRYFSDFLANIEELNEKYEEKLKTFVEVFTDPRKLKYATRADFDAKVDLYDQYERVAYKESQYQWYFSSALTIPTLFHSYEKFLKKKT